MELFIYNISWMAFNLHLAVLPIIFIVLFRSFNKFFVKVVFLILWFLYIPNSLYIITDVLHLIQQWVMVDALGKVILIIQYAVLELAGLLAFLMALYPFETFLRASQWRKNVLVILIVTNFVIGIGMVVGRIDRVNSWDVFLAPEKFFHSAIHVFTSFEMFSLAFLFGLFANFFYFLFRNLMRNFFDLA